MLLSAIFLLAARNAMDLQAGGFSSSVKPDDVVPSDCLEDMLGPHWATNTSETFDQKTVGNNDPLPEHSQKLRVI